jgi:alginate O-acetyltransferase complex protein AlgI
MLFCTVQYAAFLAAILVIYWSLPWPRARVGLLLAASLFFYASWNKWLALLIGVTTVMDYLIARGLDATASERRRKLLLVLSLVVNVGLLVAFKYANFFLDSLRETLHACGASASLPVLSVILPVGISFYTFEAINYTVDVYRRRIKAERNLAHFMLFILFFPHLVAGPIVRAKDFLPQVAKPKRWSWPRAGLGLWLIVLGAFKKLAVADRMALYADPVFGDPTHYSTGAIWLAALAFALQIYCDFSGYTDMALGSAHLLGYKLAVNFRMPYFAANVTDFWRRWHISLSSWLRDYLFIPLGGSRGGRWKTYRNLLVVMTIGGLWHGAAWTFVVWGALQGVLLIGHKAFRDRSAGWPVLGSWLESSVGTAARVALTFLCAVLSFAIFRAASLHDLGTIFTRLFVPADGADCPLLPRGVWVTVALVLTAHAAGTVLARNRIGAWRWAARVPAPALGLAAAALFNLAVLMAPGASKAFIYFQF